MVANQYNPINSMGIHNTSYSGDPRSLIIRFWQKTNSVTIKGWSIKEDVHAYYERFFGEISDHFKDSDHLTCNFQYEWFNATTVKYIFCLIKKLNKYQEQGKHIKINWLSRRGDMEMMETGKDLKAFCNFNFHIGQI